MTYEPTLVDHLGYGKDPDPLAVLVYMCILLLYYSSTTYYASQGDRKSNYHFGHNFFTLLCPLSLIIISL